MTFLMHKKCVLCELLRITGRWQVDAGVSRVGSCSGFNSGVVVVVGLTFGWVGWTTAAALTLKLVRVDSCSWVYSGVGWVGQL